VLSVRGLTTKAAPGKDADPFLPFGPCLIGVEACGDAFHWAWKLSKLEDVSG